jgi:preprotein translocase subunit SecY
LATSSSTVSKGGKFGDLKRRLWFLLGALVVYRIGAHIPVPGIDAQALSELFKQQQGGILGMFNMFSGGGALSRFTIFALGIMPYISASIIMQLMTHASPQLEALKKEGEAGRRKITQYTRYGTVFLALFQGIGIAVAVESQPGLVLDPGMMFRFVTVTTLVTGTMFLMWLGEQVTERGLGNGISIIIFAGIAAGLPNAIGGLAGVGAYGCHASADGNRDQLAGGSGHRLRGVCRTRVSERFWSTTQSARLVTRFMAGRVRTCR